MANLEDTTVTGSDSDPDHPHFHCQPCKTDGTVVTAVCYCKNCEEYLCQRCYDGHLIPSVTRKHELVGVEHSMDARVRKHELEGTDISKYSENQKTGQQSMRCDQHTDKPIEYHCPSHSFFGCHICFFQNHRTCADVKFIPDVAKDVTSTEEYREFKATLKGVASICSDLVAWVETYGKDIDINKHEVIRAFQDLKKEVLDAIENIEKQLMEEVGQFKKEESLKISVVKNKVQILQFDCQRTTSAIELLQAQQQNFDLYRTMVQAKERLMRLQTEVLDAKSSIRERKLVFNANMDVLTTLKQPFGLGLLNDTSETRRIQNLKHVSDINVKCTDDTATCRIIGSVLVSKHKLVLNDYNNNKLKLCDPGRNKVVSDLKFNSFPWDVCKVDDNQVAVTLFQHKKVVLVALEPSLSVVREIVVEGACCGVGYCDGKLVVSSVSPIKLEILDMQGSVLTVVQNDTNGQLLFNNPNQLCVNASSKLIYVSNYSKNELLCLKIDGTVVCRYTDKELAGPWQAVVDSSGTFYVCGRNSHNVHQVTRDYQKVRVLLSATDGLNCPESISYDESEGRVYIGQLYSDFVKVYKVTSEKI